MPRPVRQSHFKLDPPLIIAKGERRQSSRNRTFQFLEKQMQSLLKQKERQAFHQCRPNPG